MRVLMVTSEWPTSEDPIRVPFLVNQVCSLREEGVEVDVFFFRGRKNPLLYLKAWYEVRHKVSKESYDLIHAQWGQSALLALPKILPLVITFRGSDLEGLLGDNHQYQPSGQLLSAISKFVSHHADQIIVVSERLGRHLSSQQYHVIPNGLNLSLFCPVSHVEAREKLNLPLGKKLVLFAAEPANPIKRFSLAQQALTFVQDKMDVELVVAQQVPHDKMPLYMSACDALVLTSIHEGSPNVVKEALACNLPIVSTDVGDVSKRIGAVSGCYLCPTDTAEAIGQGLFTVLSSNQRIEGRAHVLDLEDQVIAKKIIAVYQQAISGCSK